MLEWFDIGLQTLYPHDCGFEASIEDQTEHVFSVSARLPVPTGPYTESHYSDPNLRVRGLYHSTCIKKL